MTEDGGAAESASGLRFESDTSIQDFTTPDTLIVTGPYGVPEAPSEALALWLDRQAGQSRRYGSTCTGAFLLAHAGLLAGRQATTHWQYADRLASEFPDIRVKPDSIFVRDGPVFTSAGVAAAIDLTLSLIEEDHGRALALWVARRLVVFLKRPGGQSQFSTTLEAQYTVTGPIDKIRLYILQNPRGDLSLNSLAATSGVSPRKLSRLFKSELRTSLGAFVEGARVDMARRLLEQSNSPIKAIANAAGFGSTATLRRAFLRRLDVTPQEYRARFRSSGPDDHDGDHVGSRLA